ncbi:MAG: L,D-transpeptidase family protein [Bifidobacterium sp.]|nr:L,D-transpeptidase family protein [Bifidobacterium sp.]
MTSPANGNNGFTPNNGAVPPPPAPPAPGETTQVFTTMDDFVDTEAPDTAATSTVAGPPLNAHAKPRRRAWPWVLLAIVLLVAAACAGTWMFFQNRALPGTTLWGHDMTGKTAQQVEVIVDTQVADTRVPVSYNGKTAEVSAADLGVSVDSAKVAEQVLDSKRDDNIFERYMPWVRNNVDPAVKVDADPTALDQHLGTNSDKPVDASLVVSEDGKTVEVQPAAVGSGADPTASAQEAVATIKGLGDHKAKTVEVTLKEIQPTVTDTVANVAKTTVNNLLAKGVNLTVDGHKIASYSADDLLEAARIEPGTTATLASGEARNGVVVFSAEKLQDAFDKDIKPTLKSTPETREVIVDKNDNVTEVVKEGHDGVTLDDGADAKVGEETVAALADGTNTVKLAGTVKQMETKKTQKYVIVDLSDHKAYVYQDGKKIKEMHITAGQGNDYETGKCGGDLCTPTGDFNVWLKYPSQNMSGTLTLSNGEKETWDVKDVGYVNYFSKSGCVMHRIATSSPMTDAEIAEMGRNTSHGCIGLGWDVAEWFYDWCGMGTSVHVQA